MMSAKIDDLIARLEEIKKSLGNLDVLICVWDGECDVNEEMAIGVEMFYGFGVEPKKVVVFSEKEDET
jgi:hypothetical protein